MPLYHLAQLNIARMLAPLEDPIMADFVANLAPINALAESSPGFIWRLATPAGDATQIRVFEDNFLIVNMSLWESIDALYQYAYFSDHADVYRRRTDWFSKLDKPHMVLWWVPAGEFPTLEDAKAKLEYIRQHGATPKAFTFKQRFTPEQMVALQEQ